MEFKNLNFRSKNVHYKIVGNGKPMMLIHGYQADSRIWDPIIPFLSEKYRLYIPDLPGHGNSPIIQQINTMDFLAEVIYRICTSEGITNISLTGHSMGGYVALAFAQKYNQFVDDITLISAHPFDDTMAQVMARTRESELLEEGKKHLLLMSYAKKNFSDSNDSFLKSQIDMAVKIALEQPDEGMMADLAGMMARNDLSSLLTDGEFPVKIIYGVNDSKIPVNRLDKLKNKKVSCYAIESCGHLCLIEKPEKVAEIILS